MQDFKKARTDFPSNTINGYLWNLSLLQKQKGKQRQQQQNKTKNKKPKH